MKTDGSAYPRPWRIAAAVLVALHGGSLLAIAALLLYPDAWPAVGARLGNPLRLLRAFAGYSLAPGVAAWLLRRAFAVRVAVDGHALALERRGQRIEIPCDAIDAVVPWTIPLPSAGVRLRLASGRWFPQDLAVEDPIALGDALVTAGAPEHARAALTEAPAAYARSRRHASRRWYRPVLAFVVFGLVPAVPMYRLHQWIAYGGTFGEYYMYGLKAYVLGFAIYWSTVVVYLLLWAAVLRALLEPVVMVAAATAPRRTPHVRRAVEAVDVALYYGGVLAFLLRVYLQS